jgi:hypothetical protein
MKKFLLPLLVVASVSSAFAAKDSQLTAVEPLCISIDSPISFVAKDAVIDTTSVYAPSINRLSNSAAVAGSSDYSNRWNSAPSDATLDLQKASNGDLNGTVVLTELRKQTVDLELQSSGMPAACVTSIALSVLHGNKDLVGGTAVLNLSTGQSINLVF